MLQKHHVRQALRLAAVCSWITLTVLSLVPGSDRPHTGASGNVEHAVAYALASVVTRLAFPGTRSRFHLLGFSVASGFFEVCQIWIPGRSAGVDNWAASSFGALVGILLGRAAMHYAKREMVS